MTHPSHRPDATEELTDLLRDRILVLDGAMGTMIQGHRLDEAAYRGERFADVRRRPRRRQRPALADQPRRHPRHPPGLPRGRRRHHLHQHLQRHPDLAGRLRPRGPRLRAQRRRRRPSRARPPTSCHHPRPAAVRRRLARPDLEDRVDLARRQRPGRPQRDLRRAGRGVPRGGARPGRRRRRPAPDRDDLRHPQRQGRDLRPRDAVRRARPPLAGHRLGHHHRRQRPHPLRSGHRGVLELGAPRPAARRRAQLRARRRGAAALRRRAVAGRRLLRLRPPERRAAQRVR